MRTYSKYDYQVVFPSFKQTTDTFVAANARHSIICQCQTLGNGAFADHWWVLLSEAPQEIHSNNITLVYLKKVAGLYFMFL